MKPKTVQDWLKKNGKFPAWQEYTGPLAIPMAFAAFFRTEETESHLPAKVFDELRGDGTYKNSEEAIADLEKALKKLRLIDP